MRLDLEEEPIPEKRMSKWKTTKVTGLKDPFEGLFDRSIKKENAIKVDGFTLFEDYKAKK